MLYFPIGISLFMSRVIYLYYDFGTPSIFVALHGTIIKHLYGILLGFFILGFRYNIGGE